MKIIFIFILPLLACGPGPLKTADAAGHRAVALIGGSAETSTEVGSQWQVSVREANGANVNVTLDAASGDFVSVSDQVGPFDYDCKPLASALSCSQAQAKARAIEPGSVVALELAQTDAIWIWEIYVRSDNGTLHEVRMIATSGELQSEQVKDVVD